MSIDWDPVAGIQGLHWLVVREGGMRLDHAQRAVAGLLPCTADETRTAVHAKFRDVVGDPTIVAEVFNVDTLTLGPPTVDPFAPNETVSLAFTSGTGTINGDHTDCNEQPSPNDANYIEILLLDVGETVTGDFRFATAAGLGAGSQIVSSVTFKLRYEVLTASLQASWLVWARIGGVDYQVDSFTTNGTVAPTTRLVEMTENPATGDPWTEAEVQALDSTASFKWRVSADTAPVASTVHVTWMDVDVAYRDDPRLAVGTATLTGDGWAEFLLDPDWVADNDDDHLVMFRRTSAAGSAVIVTLDSETAAPFGHGTYHPALDSGGGISDLGELQTAVLALVATQGGTFSVDSQPYASLRLEAVDVAHTVSQEFTRAGTATIGWVQLVAASQQLTAVPSAPLLAKIRNGAAVQQGGTATFDPSLLADEPITPHALDETMASTVSLTDATQYHVELTCDAPEGEGWYVVVLDTETPPSSANGNGFGGTTDRATVETVESNDLDAVVVHGTVPAAPTGFTVTDDATGVGAVDGAWTATALGADFDRTIVERLDGGVWREIIHLHTEATDEFSDPRARRGTGNAESYRLRVRHTNGTKSLPTASDDATLLKAGAFLIVASDNQLSHQVHLARDDLGFDIPRDRTEDYRYGDRFTHVDENPDDRGEVLVGTVELTGGDLGYTSQAVWVRALKNAGEQVTLVDQFGERWIVNPQFSGARFHTASRQTIGFRAPEVDDVPEVVEVP